MPDPAAPPSPFESLRPDKAWAPFEPGAGRPWDPVRAGHLLRRAGFGANGRALERALADGPGKTVDRLLGSGGEADAFNREIDDYEMHGPNALPIDELRGWWLRRMIGTPHPLLERMTLFWHGWFAVSNASVGYPAATLAHVRMLRAHALGRFDAMVDAAARDPAVMLTAGGADNPKGRPNEPFARQWLAGYTVGEGAFADADVRDTARAFTGIAVRGGRLRELPRDHDDGPKTILGQAGPWAAADFARIAAAHPATARRVIRALCRAFVSEEAELPDALIEPLAAAFAADRDIGAVLRTILRSDVFFSPGVYRRRVKSPVEFAVGLCRAFDATVATLPLGRDIAELGEDLYHPPTRKGWAGGMAWISPFSLLARGQLATRLLNGYGAYEKGIDPAAAAQVHGKTNARDAVRFVADVMLQNDVPDGVRESFGRSGASAVAAGLPKGLRSLAALLAASPEYQMA